MSVVFQASALRDKGALVGASVEAVAHLFGQDQRAEEEREVND